MKNSNSNKLIIFITLGLLYNPNNIPFQKTISELFLKSCFMDFHHTFHVKIDLIILCNMYFQKKIETFHFVFISMFYILLPTVTLIN